MAHLGVGRGAGLLGILLGLFGTANPAGDLNEDGSVNGGDLGVLLVYWTG